MRSLLPVLLLLAVPALAADDLDAARKDLQSPDAGARGAAARRLGAAGERARDALPGLVPLLKDAEPWVRLEAARALVRIGVTRREVPALLERIERGDPELRLLVAEALAQQAEAAVPLLAGLLRNEDPAVQAAAAVAVAACATRAAEAVPALVDLAAAPDEAVRRAAAEALRRCAPWAEEYVPEVTDRLRFAKDERVRLAAAETLGAVGPAAKEALPVLRELRQEGPAALREAAAEALKRIDVAPTRRETHPGLRDPAQATGQAPDTCRIRFRTTKGDFVVELQRKWAPHGVDRLYNLTRIGFFDDVACFRVVPGFVVQFGLSGDSRVNGVWAERTFPDDPVKESNRRGTLSFAMSGQPDSRATQLFVNLADNTKLDTMGFAPVGRVVEGMNVVDALYGGYGDLKALGGRGPDPRVIASMGNDYLRREFPKLDYIERATVEEAK